jgi:hypothetical protein
LVLIGRVVVAERLARGADRAEDQPAHLLGVVRLVQPGLVLL